MRKIFTAFILSVLVSSARGQELFDLLLDRDDYEALETLLRKSRGKIPTERYDFYLSLVESAFDRTESSNRRIERLLAHAASSLNDREKALLLSAIAVNRMRDGEYAKAYDAYLAVYGSPRLRNALDEKEAFNLENSGDFLRLIADFPKPSMEPAGEAVIPFFRNRYSHIMVPVRKDATVRSFLFDTGANFSAIPEKTALKWGLEIIHSELEVFTATELTMVSKVAVADKIHIGPLTFHNVVFLVVPDDNLVFPTMGLNIDGIVGFPVVRLMRAFTIDNPALTITIHPEEQAAPDSGKFHPSRGSAPQEKNLHLDGMLMIAEAERGRTKLRFNLDTGANISELSASFAGRSELSAADTVQSNRAGGGGIQATDVVRYTDFSFHMDGKEILFPSIVAHTTDLMFLHEKDGNLGQDFFTRFDRVTIDLHNMNIRLE